LTGKSLVVPCYGISQDPETKNYLMIMQYMPDGNLRQYLNNNYSELSFRDNLSQLVDIVRGLNKIHRQGLIHKDLHPGNILMDNTNCYITDLGLCQPVGEASQENIYGVLPYVAPEILRRQTYTQVADIYSFGIIACEILSGCPPYLVYNKRTNCYEEIPHDAHLALKICDELRPEFAHSIMISVIDKCLDSNPSSRPTANEIAEILSS
jgi:serine/threonine protein kinase